MYVTLMEWVLLYIKTCFNRLVCFKTKQKILHIVISLEELRQLRREACKLIIFPGKFSYINLRKQASIIYAENKATI